MVYKDPYIPVYSYRERRATVIVASKYNCNSYFRYGKEEFDDLQDALDYIENNTLKPPQIYRNRNTWNP